MSDDARQTLRSFVEGGNLHDADFQPIPPERAVALRGRLDAVRADTRMPSPTAAPSDFQAALRDREAAAEEAKAVSRGADIPRPHADKPGFKQFYKAHDFVATLPAPGGLGIILLTIGVFFLIIIPATSKGETRALLLWDVLLGRKKVQEGTALPPVSGDGLVLTTATPAPTSGPVSILTAPSTINGMPPPVLTRADMPWLDDDPGIAPALAPTGGGGLQYG